MERKMSEKAPRFHHGGNAGHHQICVVIIGIIHLRDVLMHLFRRVLKKFQVCGRIVFRENSSQAVDEIFLALFQCHFGHKGAQRQLIDGRADNKGNEPNVGNKFSHLLTCFFRRDKAADAGFALREPQFNLVLHLQRMQRKSFRIHHVAVDADFVLRSK